MDSEAAMMLAKGHFSQKKRKGQAPAEGSKRAKVGPSAPVESTAARTDPEVRPLEESTSADRVETAEGGPTSSEPVGSAAEDRERAPSGDERREKKRKKKTVVTKKARAVRPEGPSQGGSGDQGTDPFVDQDIIRALTDKFALPEEIDRMVEFGTRKLVWESLGTVLRSGHHILAHIRQTRLLEAEVKKVREDLQAENSRLQATTAEAQTAVLEKTAENEGLSNALKKEEFVSAGLKTALGLEEERRKEAEREIAELKAQAAESALEAAKMASEAATQAVEEFKSSSEMKKLNVAFGQQAFSTGFELCEGRVARKFPELDLGFLEEEDDEEAELSGAAAGPSIAETASAPPEPVSEMPEPAQDPEATKDASVSPAAASPEVAIF